MTTEKLITDLTAVAEMTADDVMLLVNDPGGLSNARKITFANLVTSVTALQGEAEPPEPAADSTGTLITELTAVSAATPDDVLLIVNDPSGLSNARKITFANLVSSITGLEIGNASSAFDGYSNLVGVIINEAVDSTGAHPLAAILGIAQTADIAATFTDTGFRAGLYLASQIDDDGDFEGTLATQYGIYSKTGIHSGTGTVTNSYGLYLDYEATTGTVTNPWGIYQASAAQKNVLFGNLGLGMTTFGASGTNVLCVGNGAAPTTTPAAGNCFQMYSSDFAAGNAVPTFRTENDTVIQLNQNVSSTSSVVFTAINGLTLTANATGFSISGGTTSKTLTVLADWTIDQDLSTTASPKFARLGVNSDTSPYSTINAAGHTGESWQTTVYATISEWVVAGSTANYGAVFGAAALNANIAVGVTDSGHRAAFFAYCQIQDSTFKGTLTNQYGLALTTGIQSGTGTITNSYGVFLDYYNDTGIITNAWGIYQSSALQKNYFGGNVGLGQATFGTNATKTLSIGDGTPPDTSPANAFQLYSASGLPTFRTGAGTVFSLSTAPATTSTKLDDFAAPDDNTDLNATTTAHGLLLKATAPASGLINFVGIANGETAYTNKALFDATNPAALGTAGPGTAAVAARRDHVHTMPVAADVGLGPSSSPTFAGLSLTGGITATNVALPFVITRTGSTVQPTRSTVTSDTAGHYAYHSFLRSRIGPADVQSGDWLGSFNYNGYANGDYRLAAYFNVTVDAAPSGSYVPSKFTLVTTASTGNTYSLVWNSLGNLGIGHTTFGTNAVRVVAVGNGIAPSTSPADAAQLYSADQAAGNACLHTRTEGGAVVKLFQGAAVADATGAGDVVAQLNALLARMRANGLIAT